MREVTHQGLLLPMLQQIFPGENIAINSRKLSNIQDPVTGSISLRYNLVLSHSAGIDATARYLKQGMIKSKGETLIIIPCWWDGTIESLIASIHFQRPDIFPSLKQSRFCIPISMNSPRKHFTQSQIPGIGELMLASFPLASKFLESISIDNSWWMGEKYDGVRCCWHPKEQQLYTRSGIELEIPESFSTLIPKMFVDSEVWFGKGQFHHSQRFVQADAEIVDWQLMRLVAFDSPPVLPELNSPFEIRYQNLLHNLLAEHPFVITAPRVKCVVEKTVTSMMNHIIEDGGEGVILRKPFSYYTRGRTSSLVKLKASRVDMEGCVMGFSEDEKLVILKLPDGATFSVPKLSVPIPVQKGDVVTFSYDNYSRNSLPVNAKVLRIRYDVSWEEIVENYEQEQPFQLSEAQYEAHPMGYWTTEKGKNMRLFMEELAWNLGKDPLLSETWYSIPRSVVEETKGGRSVLSNFKGGYVNTLIQLFPDIHLNESKFDFSYTLPQYSTDVKRRRNWFINFAREKKFDPFVADNWYNIASERFLRKAQSVLQYYAGNFVKALNHLFPEIGFDEQRFFPINKWQLEENRREFLIKFAEKEGFDYLIPDNWYPIPNSSILAEKGGYGVLYHHKNNLANALVDLFPEIDFFPENFTSMSQPNWKLFSNRKQFLSAYAAEKDFDPSQHDNWYTEESQEFLHENAKGILAYYDSNIGRALNDLFPASDSPLMTQSIRIHVPQNYWKNQSNRRKFFMNFAKAKGFDPFIASNWYSNYQEIKGASGILSYYNKSMVAALLDLFPSIGLRKELFINSPSKYWQDISNRKKFFADFAKAKGFNPHVAQNWTSTRTLEIVDQKGAKGVLHYYHGNVRKALAHLFPDIGILVNPKPPPGKWMHSGMRKQVVMRMARANGLELRKPNLNFESEISFTFDNHNTAQVKGGREVLSHYNGSLHTAITELFPSRDSSKNFWKDPTNMREAFEGFAKENQFDPKSSAEWYMITTRQLQSLRALKAMSSHYGGSTASTIVNAFPSLNLEKSKFLFLK